MNKNFTSARLWQGTKDNIQKLADKHHCGQAEFIDKMANFFLETGYDPEQYIIDTPAKEMKKLRDTLVSFLRSQEKTMLKPMLQKVDAYHMQFIELSSELLANRKDANPNRQPPEELKNAKADDNELRLLRIETNKMKEKIERIKNNSVSNNGKIVLDMSMPELMAL